MSADMALVRDRTPGTHNLAVGEPFFLQEIFHNLYPHTSMCDPTYPLLSGEPELLKKLGERHPGQHVVVTNGAKQALLAACHALQTKSYYKQVFHAAPYWVSYPTLADYSVLGFTSVDGGQNSLDIATSPNNPDGSMVQGDRKWDIWDAAYASRIYGWNDIIPFNRISVWSGAKLFGVSSYRIGWLVTGEEELARYAAEYVEKTTSGVAGPSQEFMLKVLQNWDELGPYGQDQLNSAARWTLFGTSDMFMMEMLPYLEDWRGFPASNQGMFAWVKAKDPEKFQDMLARAKVRAVSGKLCGGEDGWFRFSLGVTHETMRNALAAIKKVE